MITFIKVNRWTYDPSRGLHENCKTPQLSDSELVRYLVKRAKDDDDDDENSSSLALAVVPIRKRGPVPKVTSSVKVISKTNAAKKTSAKSDLQKKRKCKEQVIEVSDEELNTVAHKKKIEKSVDSSDVNDIMLDVQKRMKELDEREAHLLRKENETAAAATATCKSVNVAAKCQSLPAESVLPMQNSSLLSLLPLKSSSGCSVSSAIVSLLHTQQTEDRINRLRDESESMRFNIMMTLLQAKQ